MTKLCAQCNGALNPDSKFCPSCGATVPSSAASEAANQPTQGGYTPPAQPSQGSYAPPAQAAQGSYSPPQQAQSSYNPPAQQPQGSYAPPSQAGQASYSPPQAQGGGYTPPTQQGYTPQAAYAPSPVQKQKKPIDKRIFLFGGGALALVLIIVLAVSLLSGGKDKGSDDPNIGVWNVVSAEMWDVEIDITDVFENGFTVELLAKGKCKLNVDGSKGNAKWTLENGVITIKGSGLDISGTLKNGVLVFEDVLGMGLNLKLQKEGGSTANVPLPGGKTTDDPGASKTEVQAKWNGSWYGDFRIVEASGHYAEYENEIFDAYMVLDVGENGDGTMAIFLGREEDNTVDAYIRADSNHFEVTEGDFWDMPLDPSVWWLALSPVDEGKLTVVSDTYIDPERTPNDRFDFTFRFRPFGELWEQEEREGGRLPPGYDDYAKAIKSGVTDPYAWEGGGSGGSSGGGAPAPAGGNAGLGAGKFSTASKTFSAAGVTISYPGSATAQENMFGQAKVQLTDSCWVNASAGSSSDTLEETMANLKGYLTYKDAQLYESTYNGAPCIVLMYDTDKNYTADASIAIYVFAPGNKKVEISAVKINGKLSDMLQDQDLLAVIGSVAW